MVSHAISLIDIDFSFGDQTILERISFEVGAGEFVCLLGPSGCGKSTLLRIVAGLAPPGRGKLLVGGVEVNGPGLDRGVVFQDYSLFPWMTTGENIVLALEQAFPGKRKPELAETAFRYLNLVGLAEAYKKLPGELSGGMRQRAAIARVFATDPPILLLDEPFGALDAITRARLQDLLLQLWQQNESARKTVLFVTHDVEEAMLMANRILVMGMKPGVIRLIRAVDMPYPRLRRQIYDDPVFKSLRSDLIDLLNENLTFEAQPNLPEFDAPPSSPGQSPISPGTLIPGTARDEGWPPTR